MTLHDLRFRGLVRNMSIRDVTGPAIERALLDSGWRLAFGKRAHFVPRLRKRGPRFGLHTLGDLERAVRRGETSPTRDDGKALHAICDGRAAIVFNPVTRRLITLVDRGR